MSHTFRCAVYTRKSSEEGLDQAFNSLDAQREAGLNYIKSQKHQGWVAIRTSYDDGGYSGGTTQRPGLQQLLEDINDGRIDVVVVYKVDRLSRSLADFAQLMQTFDERKVSFVSVTQQFNTTTSMGRLTLNMLLSFAQFEREVTGERIRDKIAATMRTGVWVCGQPPFGYRVSKPDELPGDRRLRIVESEAVVVRAIFASYLELHSLLDVAQRMNECGYTTRRWLSTRGIDHGGRKFSAMLIYRILTNRAYAGKITHRRGDSTAIHPGLHEPIIDAATWDSVHSLMATIKRRPAPVRWTHTHLLRGKVRTFENYAMSPASVSRKGGDAGGSARRVFYYCSQKGIKQGYKNCPIKTINAQHLDDLIRAMALDYLLAVYKIDLRALEGPSRDHWIREMIGKVVVAPEMLTVEVNKSPLESCKEAALAPSRSDVCSADKHGSGSRGDSAGSIPRCMFTPEIERDNERVMLKLHIKIKRHDNRRVLVAPDGRDLYLTYTSRGDLIPQPHLVRALGQAFAWHREIVRKGATLESVAREAKLTPGRVAHLLTLTRLSPAIIAGVLSGRLERNVNLRDLRLAALHLDWSLQAQDLMLDQEKPNHTL